MYGSGWAGGYGTAESRDRKGVSDVHKVANGGCYKAHRRKLSSRTEGYQERHRAMLDLARFTRIYADRCEVQADWAVLLEAKI